MLKKLIVTITIACIVIGSMSSLALAYYYHGYGIEPIHNGSCWGERAWLGFEADSEHNYTVSMYVKKNNNRYGYKATTVYKGDTVTCHSLFVAGSGGEADWDVEIKYGFGK